jgi:hypothetical protein
VDICPISEKNFEDSMTGITTGENKRHLDGIRPRQFTTTKGILNRKVGYSKNGAKILSVRCQVEGCRCNKPQQGNFDKM